MTAEPPPILEISDLSVEYGKGRTRVAAVRGASLRVGRGERVGVVGESGSGKTSLGMAVPGLLGTAGSITGGRILLAGDDLARLGERALARVRARRVSVVFQDPLNALDPVRTIRSQVAEAIRLRRPDGRRISRSGVRQAVRELLEDCEIRDAERVMGQYPHEISGGMRQRVMIAIALAGECDVLIADEPTTALDVTTQAQILRLMSRLVDEHHVAVILITHNLALVSEFCDRVAVMYGGRVVEEGPAQGVIAEPCHPYTRGLIGSIPEIGAKRGRMPAIPGIPPDLRRPDLGCAFEPRCYLGGGQALCREQLPELEPRAGLPGGRMVRCHLVDDDGNPVQDIQARPAMVVADGE